RAPDGRRRPGATGYARIGCRTCLSLPPSGETLLSRSRRGAAALNGSDQQNLMEVPGRSAESLEILARALHVKNAELQPTLEAIAATAVTMLSPARYAGLTVLARGELIPRATTGEPPLLLDALQQRLGDGPCVHAAKHQSVIRIEDTVADERWPAFCPEAARLNVR